MTTRLGAWDCKFCNNKKIWGNEFYCPNCAAPRSKGVKFYEVPNGPIVTPEIQKQLGSDPNWYCEYCDSGNKSSDEQCWNCHSHRENTSPVHRRTVYEHQRGQYPPQSPEEADVLQVGDPWQDPKTYETINKARNPKSQQNKTQVEPIWEDHHKPNWGEHYEPEWGYDDLDDLDESYLPATLDRILSTIMDWYKNAKLRVKSTSPKTFMYFGIGAAALALLVFLIYQIFFNTHIETVSAVGFNWNQSVKVYTYKTVQEESWTTHPSDAYNIKSSYKDTGRDKKVSDGWRTETYTDTCSRVVTDHRTCSRSVDNGNGSFSTESYDCSTTSTETYSCTKTRQVEDYHYEDIYDWHYVYDIDKWVNTRNYPTSGTDQNPYYETDFRLNDPYTESSEKPQLGQEKFYEVPGTYTVEFYCENNDSVGTNGYFSVDYNKAIWEMFEKDQEYTITVNAFDGILKDPTPQTTDINK